jgi:hypothetical protein
VMRAGTDAGTRQQDQSETESTAHAENLRKMPE